ncbi:GDSL lipase/esterase [Dillenia turbinata]|uniref:GDSL lipase/esterase n=1 Tax=Dillenia turbinata TaxID=194707 RepID=A0AAN8Z2P5_9MAGN
MEFHKLIRLIGVGFVVVGLLPGGTKSSMECRFPAIFNFGDSNSDTGGLSAAFGQAPWPNGETYFHYPAGRRCDGRLIIDFIAGSLGLPYLSAFLDSMGTNFRHGANFATAGSTIRPQNTTITQTGVSPFSLDVQFKQFSDFHTRSQVFRQKGGILEGQFPKEEDFSSALYTFDIGQNDLTIGYKLHMTTDQKVYALGGRSFWVHNTSPVGCLPYILDQFPVTVGQVDEFGCATPFNKVAQYFNLGLKEAVVKLREELPLAAITYVDIYTLKYTIITQAHMLGFEQPLVACCGHGGKYNFNNLRRCGAKITVNGKEILIANSCKDPSVRVNWDGIHFTEAANKWIFDRIVNGSFSDPPTPLKMACHWLEGH